MNNELINQLETFFFNKALPVIFKGIQYVLGITLAYGFILTIINSIGELF
jgi:hypothetical protein